MAQYPTASVEKLMDSLDLGNEPAGWSDELTAEVESAPQDLELEARQRFLMGQMMYKMRGRVPATTVAKAVASRMEK